MTKLENTILDNFKKHLPDLKERVSTGYRESVCKYITIPIRSEHTFDQVTYDTKLKKFTKITYPYWDGTDNDVEFRVIDISEMNL